MGNQEEKRPPINLSDLEEEDSRSRGRGRPVRGEAGSLDYQERPRRYDDGYGAPKKKRGISLMSLLPSLVVFILVFVMVLNYAGKKSDIVSLNDNIKLLNDKIASTQTSTTSDSKRIDALTTTASTFAKKDEITSAINGLKGSYVIPGDLSQYVKRGETPTVDLSSYAKKSDIPATVDMSQYAKKTEVTSAVDLSQYVKKTDLPDMTKYALKTDVTTPTPTPTGTGTTGLVSGKVTASILGNAFTGTSNLSFSAMTASTSSSQTFSIKIFNGTGKTVNTVQLAVGLQLVDTSGVPLSSGLPSGSTVVLSGLPMVWSSQSTGVSYILGFTSGSSSGFLGSLGALNLAGTEGTYVQTVTITTGTTGITNSFIVVPVVQVVSYTNPT